MGNNLSSPRKKVLKTINLNLFNDNASEKSRIINLTNILMRFAVLPPYKTSLFQCTKKARGKGKNVYWNSPIFIFQE